MTRADKIHKLANAIREYRGLYHQKTGVWIRPPRPGKLSAVLLCLNRLNAPVESLHQIDGFKTLGEFNKWIREL